MIMKKLNNRQNQVKSLDFNTNANLLFNCKSFPNFKQASESRGCWAKPATWAGTVSECPAAHVLAVVVVEDA